MIIHHAAVIVYWATPVILSTVYSWVFRERIKARMIRRRRSRLHQ